MPIIQMSTVNLVLILLGFSPFSRAQWIFAISLKSRNLVLWSWFPASQLGSSAPGVKQARQWSPYRRRRRQPSATATSGHDTMTLSLRRGSEATTSWRHGVTASSSVIWRHQRRQIETYPCQLQAPRPVRPSTELLMLLDAATQAGVG